MGAFPRKGGAATLPNVTRRRFSLSSNGVKSATNAVTGMQRRSDCRKQEARVRGRADEEGLDRVGASRVSGLQVSWALIPSTCLRSGISGSGLGDHEDATPGLTCILMDRRASKGG